MEEDTEEEKCGLDGECGVAGGSEEWPMKESGDE
jgi:hypothetical protein